MTVTGGGADDEPTRVDREPPSFPRVNDDQPTTSATASSPTSAPLFSSAGPSGSGAQISPVVEQPIDPPQGNKGGRLRWLVAGLATVLVIAIVGGALFLAAPRSGAPSASAHYAPAGTTLYAEARLDMPGDQKDNLASFMSHFPGFADQASFQQKLDESLNTLLASKASGISWTEDVKPWFGGELAFFGDPTSPLTLDGTAPSYPAGPPPSQVVVVLSVTDKAKLQSVIDEYAGTTSFTTTDYNGVIIKTRVGADATSPISYAITDDSVLVSPDVDQIKKALDTKAGTGQSLADDTFFLQQLGALHADRLATFYFDGSKLSNGLSNSTLPGAPQLAPECAVLQQVSSSAKYVGEVRAEGDHMAFTLRAPVPSGNDAPPVGQNGHTTLAESMPANTVAYAEIHGIGNSLGWLIQHGLACMTATNSTGPLPSGVGGGLGQLGDPSALFEQFLGAKPEDYLDFLQDAAIGVSYANDKVSGGLVATVDDEAIATQRVAKLISLVKLMGGGFGGGSSSAQITTEELDHNGTKVTVVHIADAGGDPSAEPLTLQIAVANGRFYLGLDDFVVGALDRQASDSLASNARYKQAMAAGPADSTNSFFVDIAAAVDFLGESMPTDEGAQFETNTKPFLDPLSSLSLVSHIDGGIVVSNGFLFVE